MASIRDHPWYQKVLPKESCKCMFCKQAIVLDEVDPEFSHSIAGTRLYTAVQFTRNLGPGYEDLFLEEVMDRLSRSSDSISETSESVSDKSEETPKSSPARGIDTLTDRMESLIV